MNELNVSIQCPKCQQSITINLLACGNGTQIYCDKCKCLINLHFEGTTPGDLIEEVKENIADGFRKAGFEVDVH